MTAELSIFRFDGADVRTVVIDGEPWWVAADVATILGYSATSAMTRTLEPDEKGMHALHTLGGEQDFTVVSEPGLFSAILRSRVPNARRFQRWVTHEVLPSIVHTGEYVAPVESPEQLMARALVTAQGVIERKDEQIAVLTPRAEAWDELASAEGDYSVADASSMLNRAGINIGPQRLFNKLGEMGWTYRGEARRWRPYAKTVDAGYMTERAMPPRIDHDGISQPVPPQVRVTARGLERLRVRLGIGALAAVEVAS